MSRWIVVALVAFYIALAIAAGFERQPWKAVYWLAACVITVAVHQM